MINVEGRDKIRRAYFLEHKSQREMGASLEL